MIRQCCQCKKVWRNGKWVEATLSAAEQREVSHGYCEACFSSEIRHIHGQNRKSRELAEPKWLPLPG